MSSRRTQASSPVASCSVGFTSAGPEQPAKSVRQQLIDDLKMAGLAPGTQQRYLAIVLLFVRRTRLRPQDAGEDQVQQYLRQLIDSGLSRGTLAPTKAALEFLFCNTLGREWGLFKKESPLPDANACLSLPVRGSAAA